MSDSRDDVDKLRDKLHLISKREQAADDFEIETINDEAKKYADNVVSIDEVAENIIYDHQQEEEWGRASFAFTYEWFSKNFLNGAYVDGWIVEQDRRIVRVQANGPGLPSWSEGQEAVELTWETVDGPVFNRKPLEFGHTHDEDIADAWQDEWDYEDAWEEYPDRPLWEKVAVASFFALAIFVVLAILAAGL